MAILTHHMETRKGFLCHSVSPFLRAAYTLIHMESKLSLMNKSLGAAIRAEIGAQDKTDNEVGERSGLGKQLVRLITTNENYLRDINVTQLAEIAHALGVTPQKLVEDAIQRAGGIENIWEDRLAQRRAMSEGPVSNVTKLPTRRKSGIRKVADVFDPEADEPDH